MKLLPSLFLAAAAIFVAPATQAAETTTYQYDALGRLITVARSGTINNGVQATYQFDPADNRTSAATTGAPSRVVVVPLNGFTIIPIIDP